jgi:hypothetical protein
VQRATAQSKTGIFRDFGVAEAPPVFQADWSDCMYFFFSLCSSCLLIWVFRVSFCTHDGTLPFRSCAQKIEMWQATANIKKRDNNGTGA